jgi:hypothetical protein
MGIFASSEGSYIAYFGLILVTPFLIGVAILIRSRGDSFARYAGLLTLAGYSVLVVYCRRKPIQPCGKLYRGASSCPHFDRINCRHCWGRSAF